MLHALEKGFDPSEPRDDIGRWTEGSGSLLTSDDIDQALNGKVDVKRWRLLMSGWTGDYSEAIRDAQIKESLGLDGGKAAQSAKVIEDGLSHLPAYNGTIYRKIKLDSLSDLKGGVAETGATLRMNSLSSFTRDAKTFEPAGASVLEVPLNRSGVSIEQISQHPVEKEILVRSNTEYRITSIRNRSDLPIDHPLHADKGWHITLEEINP